MTMRQIPCNSMAKVSKTVGLAFSHLLNEEEASLGVEYKLSTNGSNLKFPG
jgi:hypothetical protein